MTLGYAGAYALAVIIGRLTVLEGTGLAVFWPAAGIAALWMLRGTSPGQVALDVGLLFGVTMTVNLVLGAELGPALLFALANLAQGFVVRAYTAHTSELSLLGPLEPGISTLRDLVELGTGCLLAALVSFPIGTTAARLSSGNWSWDIALAWVVRNGCGAFVVAAAALAVLTALRVRRLGPVEGYDMLTGERRPRSAHELGLAAFVSFGLTLVVFSPDQQLPLAFVMIASSAWIGFRFSPMVGALHTLVLGIVVVLLTLQGWGPFGVIRSPSSQAVVVQLYVALTAIIVLMLAFGVAERQALQVRMLASEARAKARAEMLAAVTDAMVDGLVVLGSTESVVLQNPAATAMSHDEASDSALTGAPEFRSLSGQLLSVDERPQVRALNGEVVPPTDLLLREPGTDRELTVSVSAVPLHEPDSPTGRLAVLVIHDVTVERARTRELQAFAAVVAHDLKNPLSVLTSWTEIMGEQLDGAPADTIGARDSLARIHASADRMNRLISDLLDYAQAQSAALSPEPMSLDDVVSDVTRQLVDSSPDRVLHIEHDCLGWVQADPVLIRQLVNNLLGNAVKYVAPGTAPHIHLSSRTIDDMLEVTVADNGIGIPDASRGRVFDSFFRAAGSDYTGTGLGLAICAKAVARHGGHISAREGPHGVGTTMVFTLPAWLPDSVSVTA